MPAPVTVAQALAIVARAFEKRWPAWATLEPANGADLVLHPPTERAALRDLRAVAEWAESWRAVPWVQYGARAWPSLGAQTLPERLVLPNPEAVAAFVGRQRFFTLAKHRAAALTGMLAVQPAPLTAPARDAVGAGAGDAGLAREGLDAHTRVHKVLRAVVEYDDADFERLCAVVEWLQTHPHSGLYPRQLPVRGVDTKWLEAHRKVVERLLGSRDLGLATPPELIRLRFLDPRLAPGALTDLAAPLTDLARLPIKVAKVLVVENLQSVLPLPELPGTVAIHGSGYAVSRLAEIPWVAGADVLYWGDLDSDGFNILARLRSHLPDTRSILMDAATVRAHLDLAVPDTNPRATFAGPLTDAELAAVAKLHDSGQPLRIEQERLPWQTVLTALGGDHI